MAKLLSRAAAKTNCFPSHRQPQMPAQDVLLALSKYDSAIERLRETSKLRIRLSSFF